VTAANPPLSHCDEEEAARAVGDLLTNAVRKRMVADVPVGAFLSGGLDSSAVVALMAEHGAAPLHTFSVGIKDLEGYNEFEHARHVADRFGARHHEIMIGRQDVEDYLPKLVYHQDEPLSDPVCVPLYYVSRLAVEAGIKVVQVGEGSDEQFLGYESRVRSLRRYLRTWQPLLSLPAPALRGLHGVAALASRTTNRAGRFERILAKAARGEEPFLGSIAFGDQAKEHILTEKAVGDGRTQAKVDEIVGSLRASWPQSDISHRMMYLDLKLRLAELLLMRVDKVTMSTGLEAREPFMDYRLVEYTMRLPRTVKLKGWDPKHVLKRSMEGRVPESILRRRKQAFAAPVGEWLRHGLGGYARQVILQSSLREQKLFRYDAIGRMLDDHEQRRGDYGVRIWNLMNLSAWHDQWICRRDGGA
jgi:asparagine synthase (glutamine-hydrolysing)